MLTLMKNITAEQQRLSKTISTVEPVTEFFDSFLKRYPCYTIDTAAEADKSDLIVALLLTKYPDSNVKKLKYAIHSLQPFIGEDFDYIHKLIGVIENIYEKDLDSAMTYVLPDSYTKRFSDQFDFKIAIALKFKKYLEEHGVNPNEFSSLIEIYPQYKKDLSKCYDLIESLQEIKKTKQAQHEGLRFMAEVGLLKTSAKKRDKMVSQNINDIWYTDVIEAELKDMTSYGNSLIYSETNRKKQLTRQMQIYESFADKMCRALQGGEITSIKELLSKVQNPDIRMQALKLIYSHNIGIYEQLQEEYATLAANDASHYQVLLENYHISPTSYDVKTIMHTPLGEVESMLKMLKRLRLTEPQDLLPILQKSNIQTISTIVDLCDKGLISSDFLMSNKDLLIEGSPKYQNLVQNMSLINERKINYHYFEESFSSLLSSPTAFAEALRTLDAYSLTSSMRTGLDYSFLGKTDLAPAIDTLLELGYEQVLTANPGILNYKDRFPRLYLLKALNIPVTSEEDLISVLTTEKFMVPDANISEYLYNAVPYKLSELSSGHQSQINISTLEKYLTTPRTYDFSGVLISKNKVERNLPPTETGMSSTEELLNAILTESILSDEEVEKITSIFGSKENSSPVKQKIGQ